MSQAIDDLNAAVAAVVNEPGLSYSNAERRDALRAIQAAQDSLDAAKAAHLHELAQTGGYEYDGASSLRTWCRNELRLEPGQAKGLCAAASTMSYLSEVGDAARRGKIRAEHVREFTYGIRFIGFDIIKESVPWLLDVGTTCEPSQLHQVMRALREAVYPDKLDKAWARGMAKRDFQVNAVRDGWHVNGFLDIITGAKLNAVIDSLGAPREAGDTRCGADRRVEALEDVADSILESGLPTDRGVRPHMSVLVDAHSLASALNLATPAERLFGRHASKAEVLPAELLGFGSIGPQLLAYLSCVSAITPILTNGETDGPVPQARILNVGRTSRLATPKQREAVRARQDGQCAAPGCTHTHLEIHHPLSWANGGATDLDNLVGLCPACHRLVHRGLLEVSADMYGGFHVGDRDRPKYQQIRRVRGVQARYVWRHRHSVRVRDLAEMRQKFGETPGPARGQPQRSPGLQRV